MSSAVVTSKNFDVETVVLTVPKPNANKNLTAAIINGATKSGLYIETPYCISPFGVSAYDAGNTNDESKKSYTLSLKATAGANDEQANVEQLFNILRALDEKMIDWGVQHSQLIFKKTYTSSQRSIVEALYKRCVKSSVGKDGTVYPDRIDLKIMKKEDNSPDVYLYKDSPNAINLGSFAELETLVTKGATVKAIIQPRIYFMPGSFGMNVKVIQIKVPQGVQKPGKPLTYAFSDPIVATASASSSASAEATSDDKAYDSEVDVDEHDV